MEFVMPSLLSLYELGMEDNKKLLSFSKGKR